MVPKIFFSLFFFLCFLYSNAEITKGTINVYDKSKKEIVFKLYDNTKIECGDFEGKWQSMVIYLPSTKAYFKANIKLKKGDALIDYSGRKIGYVVSNSVDATPLYSQSDNSYQMRYAGYITANDVRQETVPENILENIITSNRKHLVYRNFKEFIAQFGLKSYKDDVDKKYPPNRSYVLSYDIYVVSNAVFRIQLIFNKDNLVAILHSRKLNVTGFNDLRLQYNHLLWAKNRNEKEMRDFAKTYHQTYEVPDCECD